MLDTMCDVMKAAYNKGWISTRDGNISYRRKDEKYLYVSPSGVRKQNMNSEMIIKLEFAGNDIYHRVDDNCQKKIIGLQPSGELPLHNMLQRRVPNNRIVLHLHPTHIIAAMYAGLDLQKIADEFPEINRYTKVGPNVPKVAPISEDLAITVCNVLNLKQDGSIDFDILGLDRHGVIAIAEDAWSAFEHVERVNSVCEMVLLAGPKSYKSLLL